MIENQIISGNPAIGGEAVEDSSSEQQQDESSTGNGPAQALLPSKSDPRAEAAQVVADLGLGVEAEIGAYVRVNDAIESFERDTPRLNDFLAGLVDGHVLSAREARMGLSSPKLSKLRRIGEHAALLRHPEILALLKPGYSLLYQVVELYGELTGDETVKIKALTDVLSAAPGNELSREHLIEHTKLAKRAAKLAREAARRANGGKASPIPEPAATNFDRRNIITALLPTGASIDEIAKTVGWKKAQVQGFIDAIQRTKGEEAAEDDESVAVGTTLATLIKIGTTFDLLLLTPDERELARLREDYGEAEALARCLPLHRVVGPDAIAVVSGWVRDLPVILDVVLPLCGFGRRPRVLLPRPPASPDVTDADVIVVAARGEARLSPVEEITWGDDPIEPTSVAELLVPDASGQLHVFARGASDGWTTLTGDETWVERPSL
jgi:hypothetical protein